MRSSYRGGFSAFGGGAIPPMIRTLLIINVAAFLLQQVTGRWVEVYFGLTPALFWSGYVWQAVSYMFLHGGFGHIFFNMLILWMFGRVFEQLWGSRRFLTYYMICGIGAGLLNAAITPGSPIPTIGASGAIYGLLMAFGITFPNQMIYVWFLFPIRAKYFVIILVVIEFVFGFNPSSPIAHFAHLGGMLVGLLYLKWPWLKQRIRRLRGEHAHRSHMKKHMKVVYNRREEMQKLQQEVDDLLDKINKEGLDSLSAKEKARLKEASRKLREWEMEGGRL